MSNTAIAGFTPVWEGLITDGSFQPAELLKRVKKDLKTKYHSVKYKAVPTAQGGSVILQFRNPDTGKQVKKGCGGCKFDLKGVQDAAEKADLVTQTLNNGSFSWDWYETEIQGKSITTKEKEQKKIEKEKEEENKPVGELFEAYKKHWFDEDKRRKNSIKRPENAWYQSYRWLEKTFVDNTENYNKPISNELVIECIKATQKDSDPRIRTLNKLVSFLDWCGKLDKYSELINKYKKENKTVSREQIIPSDTKIESVFNNGFIPYRTRNGKKHIVERYRSNHQKWQFLYALLATYGLRVHEAWNIKNWNKPVTLGKGDWVEIEEITDNYEDIENDNIKVQKIQATSDVIPAILDPNNTSKFLAVGNKTKTGYRLVMPLSPIGKDWFEQFGLSQEMNLPDIKDALMFDGKNQTGGYVCSTRCASWFRRHDYGFTPHKLRHAYNHRGHGLGINVSVLSQSLGHSIEMNTTTYHDTMPIERKLSNMVFSLEQVKANQSKLEKLTEENQKLKEENIQLKTALKFKDEEIERLRTELRMMKAVQS